MKSGVVGIVSSVIAIALSSACTHQRTVDTLRPPEPSVMASAELADGSSVAVRATETPEGLRWVARDVDARSYAVEDARLHSYTVVRRGRGALEGAALGVLGGVAIGVVLGISENGCDNNGGCIEVLSPGETVVLGGVLFGALGGAIGGVVGATVGSKDVYHARASYVPRVSPTVVRRGGGVGLSWTF